MVLAALSIQREFHILRKPYKWETLAAAINQLLPPKS